MITITTEPSANSPDDRITVGDLRRFVDQVDRAASGGDPVEDLTVRAKMDVRGRIRSVTVDV